MKRKLLFVLVSLLATSVMWAADGDKFTKTTPQGIEMVFQVISEAGKTCQAGYFNEGSYSSTFFTAVDRSTEGDVTIPSEIDGYSVIAISERAFSYCNKLSSIVIPSSVKTINSYAFSSCSISSITIPEGVETIKEGAFRSCRNLENVVLPNSVTTIENDAFYGCEKLATINITNSVTTIGTYLFAGCNNVAVSVNNCSRWRFQNHVFSSYNDDDTSISIIIQNGVTTIGGSCFYNNDAITSVSIPNSVTKIEGYNRIPSTNGAFQACPRLSSLSIPNSVTSIGGYAFYGCGFTSIEIPGSVTRLEDNTFAYCPNLENVTINEGVEMIFNAFRNFCQFRSIGFVSNLRSAFQ